MEKAGCNNFKISLNKIAPCNIRALRFMKATFICEEDRWKFNRNFNAQQSSHGFTVASLNPQHHIHWLSD